MRKYVNYLVQDIAVVKSSLPADVFYDYVVPFSEEDDLSLSFKPLGEWYDLQQEVFPPANRLSEKQMEMISEALLDLWETLGFRDYIYTISVEKRYVSLIEMLKAKTKYDGFGVFYFLSCDKDTANCPFEECQCEKLRETLDDIFGGDDFMEYDEDIDFDNDIPF
ncbi:MAG: hypothetical protein GY705_24535 [Bacteroidetes bacterium]|nr:hypothetical protein [Bacteroidota bacterium]